MLTGALIDIMKEPFDIYTDGFNFGVGPETVSISFVLTPAPHEETEDTAPKVLGTVRMSVRQMRALTYAGWLSIRRMERDGLVAAQPEGPGEMAGSPDSTDDWQYLWALAELDD